MKTYEIINQTSDKQQNRSMDESGLSFYFVKKKLRTKFICICYHISYVILVSNSEIIIFELISLD